MCNSTSIVQINMKITMLKIYQPAELYNGDTYTCIRFHVKSNKLRFEKFWQGNI